MLGLAATSQARRAAISAINPLVAMSRRRLGPIPDNAWRQPYMMGFIGMLISLTAARQCSGRLSDNRLGLAQVGAWTTITGIADDQVGEDFCYLSASRQKDFVLGCRNAHLFFSALAGEADGTHPEIADAITDAFNTDLPVFSADSSSLAAFGKGGSLAAALWQRYFEDQMP